MNKEMAGMWYVVDDVGYAHLYYADGDECAVIHGNLGLDIQAEEAARFICEAIEAYSNPTASVPSASVAGDTCNHDWQIISQSNTMAGHSTTKLCVKCGVAVSETSYAPQDTSAWITL